METGRSRAGWRVARFLDTAAAEPLFLVGVFSNAIGYGIDQYVLRRIPVRRFSVLLALLPVTAVAFGWIALDQVPSTVEFGGIALVLVGVVLQERDELPVPALAEAP